VPIGTVAARPNIVFVLADDLSTNLVRYMPAVRALAHHGATFTNYYVTDSLCCPSRTSIFTGLLPHDSGVFTNSGRNGGYGAFDRHRDGARTFAVALQRSGYRTGLMGKYLNGYKPGFRAHTASPYVPLGWNAWDVTGNGYAEYRYSLNENHRLVHFGTGPSSYLTNVLSRLSDRFVVESGAQVAAKRQPFALEVATFAPHEPYVYAGRDAHRFTHLHAPHTPAFGENDVQGNPRWLDEPPLTRRAVYMIDRDFRRRVRAVQSIDRMVASLERRIAAEGLTGSTYFVFSSDNGYHMGEHRLRPGKMTAFDTDIRVPLIIAGPGIRPGMRVDALADNVDLAPTFEQLAGHTVSPSIDGRSLVPLLEGRRPTGWRRAVLVEHRGPDIDVNDPDYPKPESGNPPSYEAMRLDQALYVEYADGEHEYYDIASDPYELRNAYSDLGPVMRATLHRELMRLSHCHGAGECHLADQLLPYASSTPRRTQTTLRPITPRS
jgi:arylsulfatase A-like enzyme